MWFFNRLLPGYKLRNPIQGEFFATAAIDGPAQALVRESIQNSMDAKNALPVRVAITVVTDPPPQRAIAQLFQGAWEHFAAAGNGLQDPKPHPEMPCPYLVVEDFNTRGLTGDPAQADLGPGEKNPFFLFFRAEGLSAKSGEEIGRWGVGKFVFPRSSRASTCFGITVRHDDARRLLMGAATLKGHHVDVGGSPVLFTPDGVYGVRRSEDDLVLPIEDAQAIEEVSRLFGLERRHEPGLSVIVPFIDKADFTYEQLLDAVVRDYFTPILAGQLEVALRHDERTASLKRDTLVQVLESNATLADKLLPTVNLAKIALSVRDEARIVLGMPDPARAARWNASLVSPEALEALRQKLRAREPVAVRVPLTVKHKRDGDLPSHFDIYMQTDRNCNERPVFVREGIIVSDVRGRRAREIRSLVIVEDRPLAGMLGDSENPAHTQWQKDSSNFRGRYTYGKAAIDFVTDSVGELLAILNQASKEPDASLTVDFFSIDSPDDEEDGEDGSKRRQRTRAGDDATRQKVEVEPRPTRLTIQRSAGGFTIKSGTAPPPPPFLVEVRCAYETHSGNPLKKWNPADFAFGRGGLPVELTGAVSGSIMRDNHLVLRVEGHDFKAEVKGFDTRRDVYVRADVREVERANSEA